MYVILGVVYISEIECLSNYKSSKDTWDYFEKKYEDDFFSMVEDRSLNYEVGTFGCSLLMTSHLEEVLTRSMYWTYVESDEDYSIQDTYDQLVYDFLKIKKTIMKIDHSKKEKDKNHKDLSSRLLNVILEREKVIEDLKLMLDNYIKSFKILLHDKDKYLDRINELERSTQHKELKDNIFYLF